MTLNRDSILYALYLQNINPRNLRAPASREGDANSEDSASPA